MTILPMSPSRWALSRSWRTGRVWSSRLALPIQSFPQPSAVIASRTTAGDSQPEQSEPLVLVQGGSGFSFPVGVFDGGKTLIAQVFSSHNTRHFRTLCETVAECLRPWGFSHPLARP